ncbi:MAG: 3-phosphoshikimate 1-carboxyvinyltransferase, partial [Ornithinimicrobium sp.]
IDAGLAGTVMRFVPPLAALAAGVSVFDGDDEARTRPIAALLDALADVGVRVESPSGDRATRLPFVVRGTGSVRGGDVDIDASASSQFVSALLLVGARFEQGLTLRHVGATLPSRPHIEMTMQALKRVGVEVRETPPGVWRVEPGRIRAIEVDIEPDLSSAAPFLALAAVTSGTLTVTGWPQSTTQAGDSMRSVLEAMGARCRHTADGLEVSGPAPGGLRGVDVDLHDVGELTPVIAAVAAQASTPSRLRGVAHLRGHETDRLQALQTELSRMGGDVEVTPDGLVIRPRPLRPALLRTYRDHRMAMAAAVLGAGVAGVRVQDVETTGKTFPGFPAMWSQLLGAEPAPV